MDLLAAISDIATAEPLAVRLLGREWRMLLLLAALIGVVAGLRAFTAPAAVSLAARYGHLGLAGTPFAFLGLRWTAWIFLLLAVIELVGDQLPSTPSRKVPLQFGTRILMGALAGGALGASGGAPALGLVAGVVGAVFGTLGGATARAWLAARFKRDLPAALIEDAIAIGGGLLIVCCA
jgi:uncharacterized membrane protein